jgi:uncharacterized RDD family membrane protein YckC
MQEYANQEQEVVHLFDGTEVMQYQAATRWQRFFNLFVDNLVMQYGISYLTGAIVGYILMYAVPNFEEQLAYEDGWSWGVFWLALIIGELNYLLYYTICEKSFKGYTLGKLLTGTRAIRNDGGELTFKDAFLRSLSRLVPFEAFSGFGTPWHDTWTKTTVIKAR